MKNIFFAPRFVNAPDENRVAPLVNKATWSVIISVTIYSATLLAVDKSITLQKLLLALTPIPTAMIVLFFLRRGRISLSGKLLVWTIWSILVAATLVAGGIHAPAYAGLVIPILLSCVVLGRRDAILVAIVSAVVGYLLLIAEANNLLLQTVNNTGQSLWVTQSLFFILVVLIASMDTNSRDKMLAMVTESEQNALRANKNLQAEISARIKAEEELRFQADILDQVSDAIIVADGNEKLRYWNQSAETLYGLNRKQTMGKSFREVLIPTSDQTFEEDRRSALIREGYWQGRDRTIVSESGKEIIVESRVRFIAGEDRSSSTIIVSARDIHLRIKAEEALAYRTKLQGLVTQLAIRFINSATDSMKQDFEEALKMVSEFFDVDYGKLGLIDPHTAQMNITHKYSRPGAVQLDAFAHRELLVNIEWFFEQLRDVELIKIDDVSQLSSDQHRMKELLQQFNIKAIIMVPLVSHGESVGLLTFYTIQASRTWTDDAVHQLQVLGEIVVSRLEQHQYEVQMQMQTSQLDILAQQLSAIHDLEQAIFSSRSLKEISEFALNRLQNLTDCKCCSIFLLEDDNAGNFFRWLPIPQSNHYRGPVSLSSIDYLHELQEGMILLNEHLQTFPPESYDYAMVEEVGVHSVAHIPLIARSELIGILHIGFAGGDEVNRLNIDTIESVASSLSLAIVNAQLNAEIEAHAIELEQRVAERTDALKRQYRLRAALAEIELAINHPTELQKVLEQIAHVTAETLPADIGVSVLLWDSQNETFYTSATSVKNQKSNSTAHRARKQGGATRWILDHGDYLIVPDTSEDPFSANSMITEFGIGSYAGFPLSMQEQTDGVLYALRSEPNVFNDIEIDFLEAVASRASLAITKVRLFEQAKVVAAEEARQRIARDLHDGVTQSLFSASVIAESLPRLIDNNPGLVQEGLQDLQLLTQGTLAEMRTLLFELRPDALERADLGELLRQLTVAVMGRTCIPISLTIDPTIDLPPSQQIGIYRIAQEALTNISRHAQAKQVEVKLQNGPEGYILTIRDDGKGFDPNLVPPGHFGLQIIHERALEMGAELIIESSPGQGACIEVLQS